MIVSDPSSLDHPLTKTSKTSPVDKTIFFKAAPISTMLDVGDVLILFYHISRTICWGVFLGAGITWVAHQPMLFTPLGAKECPMLAHFFLGLPSGGIRSKKLWSVWRSFWSPQVLLDVQEGYQWNSLKGLRFLEWCSSNVLAEFLVKVDDDVRLDAFWDAESWGITSPGHRWIDRKHNWASLADGSEDDPTNPWMWTAIVKRSIVWRSLEHPLIFKA